MTEKILSFNGQSYKWSSFRIVLQDVEGPTVTNVRLMKREAGNLTEYMISPGGNWHGRKINYSGEVSKSKHSRADAIIALASSGSWSGGSNYKGFVFGKPGAIIYFSCKGEKKWLVFTATGIEETHLAPGSVPMEVK